MNKKKTKKQNIFIYKDMKGNVSLKADWQKETVWATLNQIADLFDVQKAAISKHLKNIYKSQELSQRATVSILETVQKEGARNISRNIEYYNLDAIIAVGYRVNSRKATRFRIWATKTLRDYIVNGIAVNEGRIKQLHEKGIKDLSKKIEFIQRTIQKRQLDQTEVDGLLSVINGYANSWMLLQKYDEGDLVAKKSKTREKKRFDYEFVRPSIDTLKVSLIKKGEASDLFGNERDHTFSGILKTIYQTFGGKELYASLEEKAAHLLYFVIKDHPFSDGNKRTGSFLFILFLELNGLLYRKNGDKKINDTALVALALLIAESNPSEKENMIALITNLIA